LFFPQTPPPSISHPAVAMASKASLVEQVKQLQRSSPEAKQSWWDYCDKELGGVHDPNRHDEQVLQDFLTLNQDFLTMQADGASSFALQPMGHKKPMAPGRQRFPGNAMSMPGYGHWPFPTPSAAWAAPASDLAEFVKIGQRQSATWKAAWQSYCATYGNGFNDPTKYDGAYIIGFIDYVGSLAEADLGMQMGPMGVAAAQMSQKKRPAPGMHPMQSPMKRPMLSPVVYADAEKTQLVERVKAFQRTDNESKQMWWKYCDENLQGVHDPARHDKETLKAFLADVEG